MVEIVHEELDADQAEEGLAQELVGELDAGVDVAGQALEVERVPASGHLVQLDFGKLLGSFEPAQKDFLEPVLAG